MKNNSGSIPRNACVALWNIAMHDYQENVTTGQTDRGKDGQTDARQSDPYVPLCFTGDTKIVNLWKMSQATKTRAIKYNLNLYVTLIKSQ